MGIVYALLSAFFWGIGNIFIKRGQLLDKTDDGLFISVLLNALLFLLLTAYLGFTGQIPPLNTNGIAFFVLAGLLTTFLGRFFNYASIRRIGPSRASSFKVTSPVFTLIAALTILDEQLVWMQLVGTVSVLIGVWLVTTEIGTGAPKTVSAGTGENKMLDRSGRIHPGALLGILAAASFGTGHAVRKLGVETLPSPQLGATIGSCIALTAIVLPQLLAGKLIPFLGQNLSKIKRDYVIAGISTTFGQLFLFLAIARTDVSVASVLASTEPLMTLLIAPLLLRSERITRLLVVGCLFVMVGVISITLS